MQRWLRVMFVVCMVLGAASPVSAQGGGSGDAWPPITPENLDQLTPLVRLGRGSLHDVLWSPDGATLIVPGGLGVWRYDPADLTAEPELWIPTESAVSYGVFSPDGTRLALSYGAQMEVWDVASATLLLAIDAAADYLVWSPDGTWLVTAGDAYARLWNATTGALATELDHLRNAGYTALDYSPDGAYIAWGDDQGNVTVWGVADGAVVATLVHEGDSGPAGLFAISSPVRDIAFSPDGQTLVTLVFAESNPVERGTLLRYWDMGVWDEPRDVYQDGAVTLAQIDYGADGALIGIGEFDDVMGLWDMDTGKVLLTLDTVVDLAEHGFTLSPDGTQLGVSQRNGGLALWDLATGTQIAATEGDALDSVTTVAFDTVHGRVAIQARGGVSVWDVTTGERLVMVGPPYVGYGMNQNMAFTPDGTTLVLGHGDGSLWIIDMNAAVDGIYEPVITDRVHNGHVADVVFSPDGTLLATGCIIRECSYVVWDWIQGDGLVRKSDEVRGLTFVNNGERTLLIYQAMAATLEVWDVSEIATRSMTLLHTLNAPEGTDFEHFVVSPDGVWLVARTHVFEAGQFHDIRLAVWDLRSGEEVAEWVRGDLWYVVMGFTPDSAYVFAVGGEIESACTHVYDLATGDVVGSSVHCLPYVSPDGTWFVQPDWNSDTVWVWGVPGS